MGGQLFFDGFPVFFEVERAQVFRNQEALLGQFHDFYLVKLYFAGLLENVPLVGDYLLHAAKLGHFLLQPFLLSRQQRGELFRCPVLHVLLDFC